MIRNYAICILCIGYVAGCNRDKTPALNAPESIVVYSIDGINYDGIVEEIKTNEIFGRYPVLGKVELTDKVQCMEVASAIKQDVASSDGRLNACFYPRHGLRVTEKGRIVDYVICYECHQMIVIDGDSRKTVTLNAESKALLNIHLKAAGIKLAKTKVSPDGD